MRTPVIEEKAFQEESDELLCRHHWIIESPHGATSHGVCKLCGEEREFQNSASRAQASNQWCMDHYDEFITAAGDGVIAAIEAHAKEQAARGRYTKQDAATRSVRWASKNKPRSDE